MRIIVPVHQFNASIKGYMANLATIFGGYNLSWIINKSCAGAKIDF